jgi:hydrogenase maturation protein HypF
MQQLGELPVVMTSANVAGEPMLIDDDEASAQLLPHVDALLLHRRPIEVRCDDSVVRQLADGPLIIRRSRGFVPLPLTLLTACPTPLLAVGAEAKSVFALGLSHQAILSHHLGDLDHWATTRAFEQEIAHYERLFSCRPQAIAHDLHLDYAATKYAERRAERERIRLIPVQHHHAHLASCLADNESSGPAIGMILDGTGWGLDLIHGRRTVWGGELLVGDASGFQRAAHLRYVALPGGQLAIREPWRMTVTHLQDATLDPALFLPEIPTSSIRHLVDILKRPALHAATSSAGRLFDAVSGLLGWHHPVSYEGQAAEWLESLALNHPAANHCSLAPLPTSTPTLPSPPPPILPTNAHSSPAIAAPHEIDTRPLLRALCTALHCGVPKSEIAWFFHDALAALLADSCTQLRATHTVERVALSGGVFLNALFTQRVTTHLQQRGWEVLRHRRVPPSDAGLSLGQLAVAAATLSTTTSLPD